MILFQRYWKYRAEKDFGVIFILCVERYKGEQRIRAGWSRERERKRQKRKKGKRKRFGIPIPFKPLKHRRISMWISLREYTEGWYMRERMYYVNMPIPSEPLWSNPTPLKAVGGRHDGFRSCPPKLQSPPDRAVEGRMSRHLAFQQPAYRQCRVRVNQITVLSRIRSRNILQAHYQRSF